MSPISRSPAARITGFSLVEIMVGLAIGMLATIVILQVFTLSGESQRNTASGGDAQSNGAIVFYQLQQDIGQAGFGFASKNVFNCNTKWPVSSSGGNITTAVPLAPVTINPATSIVPAGDPNTDTLLIVYGNTNQQPQGNNPSDQKATNIYKPQLYSAFNVGDYIIAYPSSCAATLLAEQITDKSGGYITVPTGAASTATLYNLGSSPTIVAYAVRSGNLTMCNYLVNDCGTAATTDSSIWVPIANNIVSMRAQYWHDANSDDIPDTADRVTPSGATAGCGWVRTSLIRLVVVARNNEYSKKEVTSDVATTDIPIPNAPKWIGSETATGNTVLDVDLSNDANWKHYRYKVFQSVTPIRNVAWMDKTGC